MQRRHSRRRSRRARAPRRRPPPARAEDQRRADEGSRYDTTMDKDEITAWALKNGWREIDGHLSLTKPSSPNTAIVRLILKGTVANVEVKKPVGKWEKIAGAAYGKIEADPETGMPRGLGFETIPSFSMLMQDNKHRAVFANMSGKPPASDE
jgi:hypothetical protein